jgi:vacuolar protein sorting-associated protein 13A/C
MLTTNEMVAMLTGTRIMVMNTRKSTLEWQEHFSEIQTIQCHPSGIAIKLRTPRWEPFIPIPESTTCKWFFSKIEEAVAQWREQQNLEL